ncbi:MAG: hypothetical protein ACRELB_00085, partial [Polyangiaceae bacterium]
GRAAAAALSPLLDEAPADLRKTPLEPADADATRKGAHRAIYVVRDQLHRYALDEGIAEDEQEMKKFRNRYGLWIALVMRSAAALLKAARALQNAWKDPKASAIMRDAKVTDAMMADVIAAVPELLALKAAPTTARQDRSGLRQSKDDAHKGLEMWLRLFGRTGQAAFYDKEGKYEGLRVAALECVPRSERTTKAQPGTAAGNGGAATTPTATPAV